jgi:hypothetical protein
VTYIINLYSVVIKCVICIIIYLDEYNGIPSHSSFLILRQPPACINPGTESLLLYRRTAGRAPNSEEAPNCRASQSPNHGPWERRLYRVLRLFPLSISPYCTVVSNEITLNWALCLITSSTEYSLTTEGSIATSHQRQVSFFQAFRPDSLSHYSATRTSTAQL